MHLDFIRGRSVHHIPLEKQHPFIIIIVNVRMIAVSIENRCSNRGRYLGIAWIIEYIE